MLESGLSAKNLTRCCCTAVEGSIHKSIVSLRHQSRRAYNIGCSRHRHSGCVTTHSDDTSKADLVRCRQDRRAEHLEESMDEELTGADRRSYRHSFIKQLVHPKPSVADILQSLNRTQQTVSSQVMRIVASGQLHPSLTIKASRQASSKPTNRETFTTLLDATSLRTAATVSMAYRVHEWDTAHSTDSCMTGLLPVLIGKGAHKLFPYRAQTLRQSNGAPGCTTYGMKSKVMARAELNGKRVRKIEGLAESESYRRLQVDGKSVQGQHVSSEIGQHVRATSIV